MIPIAPYSGSTGVAGAALGVVRGGRTGPRSESFIPVLLARASKHFIAEFFQHVHYSKNKKRNEEKWAHEGTSESSLTEMRKFLFLSGSSPRIGDLRWSGLVRAKVWCADRAKTSPAATKIARNFILRVLFLSQLFRRISLFFCFYSSLMTSQGRIITLKYILS